MVEAAQILLITGSDMPHADRESGLLVDALAARGVPAQIVAWDADLAWARTPLVVVRSPWDYVERYGEFLSWARETAAVTRLVNDVELIVWNSHKGYMIELAAGGVAVVPTSLVARDSPRALQDLARSAHGDAIVLKPAISAGARGTIRTSATSSEAVDHMAALVSEGDTLVQPFLPAIADGEISLVYFGGVLSHAVRKVPADGDFRVHEEYGGSVESHVATAAERAVADAVFEAAPGKPILARIDLVTTAGGPLLMEAELIEPELFLTCDRDAAGRFADLLIEQMAVKPRRV